MQQQEEEWQQRSMQQAKTSGPFSSSNSMAQQQSSAAQRVSHGAHVLLRSALCYRRRQQCQQGTNGYCVLTPGDYTSPPHTPSVLLKPSISASALALLAVVCSQEEAGVPARGQWVLMYTLCPNNPCCCAAVCMITGGGWCVCKGPVGVVS